MATRPATAVGAHPLNARLPAVLGILLAAGVGAIATGDSFLALALVVAVGIAVLVAADVKALPLFLVFTMFVESLELGPGLRIGRVAGVLALAVLAYMLLARG